MRAKVQRWGHRLAVRIPKPLAEEAGLVDLLARDRSRSSGAPDLVAQPHDSSSPSDHATIFAAVAAMFLLSGANTCGGVALSGALFIGIARVVVGLHYPADILGGMFVRGASAIVAIRAHSVLGCPPNVAIRTAKHPRLG